MRYIALLRAINVGKHNRVTMIQLRSALLQEGIINVQTHLQSGNVLFDWSEDRRPELDELFNQAFTSLGLRSVAIFRSASELHQLIDGQPFATCSEADEHKFVTFLKSRATSVLPRISKDGHVTIAQHGEGEICYVSTPVGGTHGYIKLPSSALATTRTWGVTCQLANLCSR